MTTITIPKKISGKDNLIEIPRKEYELLLDTLKILKERKQSTEKDILYWSKEAKRLKKEGKLSVLRSLKDFR